MGAAMMVMAAQLPPAPVAPRNERLLSAWIPGEAHCGDVPVAAVAMRRPYLAYAYGSSDGPVTATYRFRLDNDGRPLSIVREGQVYLPYGEDIGPSLAASRFARGPERGACTVTYALRRTAPAATPLGDLTSYTLNPMQGQLPREAWAGIFPATATCDKEPRPAPLVQAFPDFAKVRGTPGVRDWTMFSYDLDADGAPRHVTVLTGTGNAALDAAGHAALMRSRYANGPRTGCRYPFWKAAAVLPAPLAPDKEALRPAAATCPDRMDWAIKPPLIYPAPYRKRSIEGWAAIGFDLAPWGATGNIRVLASEPAAEFGAAAAEMIRVATVAASPTGAVGCVERVHFVIARPGSASDARSPIAVD